MKWQFAVLLVLLVALPWQAVEAVIERPLKLADVIASSDQILIAKVTTWQPEKPAMVLSVEKSLKGDKSVDRLPVRLTAQKQDETDQLLVRLAVDAPVVVFVTEKDQDYIGLAFTNGTWFQLVGKKSEGRIVWQFTHIEPYLRRTYKGTTDELMHLLPEVLAGKSKAPPLDPKAKPGLGPTLEEFNAK